MKGSAMYTHHEEVAEVVPTAPLEPVRLEPVLVEPQRVEAVRVVPVDAVAAPVAQVQHVATSSQQRFAFDSVIVGIVGLGLTIVGLLAVTRAGVHGPMNTPVVDVVGFTHTASLGLIEAAMGLVLLICAASTSRSASIFFGLVLGVGALIGALQASSFKRSLALESGMAWLLVVAAIVIVLASFLIPRVMRRSTTYTTV
jgi:hypothetical protein